MPGFTAIPLEDLPAPVVVEILDYERILSALKTDLIARDSGLESVLELESEPLNKLLEVCAYRELILRARVNTAAQAVMIPYANGSDLDNLAALFAVERQVIDPGNPDISPPIPPTYEDDTRLRRRTQLSLEGHTTAGPIGSYVFWSISADPAVSDVDVTSPNPGEVLVTVLSTEADGTPSQTLQDTVLAALNHEDVRPLTDQVSVQSATIISYQIVAALTLFTGSDTEVVRQAAEQAVTGHVTEHHALGHDITLSGIYAALHQAGVQNVTLTSPAADIVVLSHQAAYCTSVSVTVGGLDE